MRGTCGDVSGTCCDLPEGDVSGDARGRAGDLPEGGRVAGDRADLAHPHRHRPARQPPHGQERPDIFYNILVLEYYTALYTLDVERSDLIYLSPKQNTRPCCKLITLMCVWRRGEGGGGREGGREGRREGEEERER